MCEVEIDPETGAVQIVAYASVNDIGRVVSPVIVRGQIEGGAVQGIGTALYTPSLTTDEIHTRALQIVAAYDAVFA